MPASSRKFAALLFAALCLAPPARSGDSPVVTSTRQGDAIEIRASARLSVERDAVWRVLTDYGRYVEFIPDLRSSRVVSRSGTTAVVEQEGDATFGPFRIPLEITFRIEEHRPQQLESHAVAGSLRALESRYTLLPDRDGTRLVYFGVVRPGFPFAAWFAQSAIEANVRRQFVALVNEVERVHAGSAPGAASR